jgi:hypothetical protein
MPILELRISDLSQDSIELSRPHLDPDRVSYYLEHLDDATPVVVSDADGILLLADGHHRISAAEQLGRPTVRADVREGQLTCVYHRERLAFGNASEPALSG